jgi:hypothetical protein
LDREGSDEQAEQAEVESPAGPRADPFRHRLQAEHEQGRREGDEDRRDQDVRGGVPPGDEEVGVAAESAQSAPRWPAPASREGRRRPATAGARDG